MRSGGVTRGVAPQGARPEADHKGRGWMRRAPRGGCWGEVAVLEGASPRSQPFPIRFLPTAWGSETSEEGTPARVPVI